MKVFEYVTDFAEPFEPVRRMVMGPGGFVRFSPAGTITVTSGNPDDNRAGNEFTVKVNPPLLPFLKFSQRQRVSYADDHTMVMDQVEGQFKHYRHEIQVAANPDGGTRLSERITYRAPRFSGDLTRRFVHQFRFRERQMRGDLRLHRALAGRSRRILIAGASGLIGTQLAALLANAGQNVGRLVRSPDQGYAVGTAVEWNPAKRWLPNAILDGVDAVINLSGESIGGRFTQSKKQAILQSRLDATATLAGTITQYPDTALIQASAIGIYGARRPGEVLTEDAELGTDFLATVVRQWEDAATPAVAEGARVVFLRTGIALSQAGGALAPQLPLFVAGVGGRLTTADAMLSWIGIDDVVRAYAHAVATQSLSGPVNMVGPEPVTQQEFADTLAGVLNRKAWLPVPGIGPKVLLGSEGYDQLIDTDQNVSSATLAASGFQFGEPTVEEALRHTLTR